MARVGARRRSGLLASTKHLIPPRQPYRSAGIREAGCQISTVARTRDEAFFELPIPPRPWHIRCCRESAWPRTPRAFSADPTLRAARPRAVRLP